jgi:hypothetical protein
LPASSTTFLFDLVALYLVIYRITCPFGGAVAVFMQSCCHVPSYLHNLMFFFCHLQGACWYHFNLIVAVVGVDFLLFRNTVAEDGVAEAAKAPRRECPQMWQRQSVA